MSALFQPRLVNDPLGDPGLMVRLEGDKRAILFDLGDNSPLSHAELLRVSHVFVSHTHIDHFIGFDRLLRMVFGQGKTLALFGPENFINNVEGKLAGFTWNLVDKYSESITIEATEVHEDRLLKATFRARDKFHKSDESEEVTAEGLLVDEPAFTVRAAILEHRVPCLGFALEEKTRVNVDKESLLESGFVPGPWLNQLKDAVQESRSGDAVVEVLTSENGAPQKRKMKLDDLKAKLVTATPGEKIVYIVDTVYNVENKKRVVDLARDADILFCESPFLAEEEDRARERRHLTSRQAGLLAHESGVRELRTFHFSQRHTFKTDQLVQEAQTAFKNGR